MSLVNFLAKVSTSLNDGCEGLGDIVQLLKAVIRIIQFGIPFVLILFGIIDLGKAVIASKEDEMKAAQKLLIRRFIYAVAVFLVVSLVTLTFDVLAANTNDAADNANLWLSCWKKKS